MSAITLQLPETLRNQLDLLAKQEGVSIHQFILYSLTRQVSTSYITKRIPIAEVWKQQKEFAALRTRWREVASDKGLEQLLAEREISESELELTPEIVAKFQAQVAAARNRESAEGTLSVNG